MVRGTSAEASHCHDFVLSVIIFFMSTHLPRGCSESPFKLSKGILLWAATSLQMLSWMCFLEHRPIKCCSGLVSHASNGVFRWSSKTKYTSCLSNEHVSSNLFLSFAFPWGPLPHKAISVEMFSLDQIVKSSFIVCQSQGNRCSNQRYERIIGSNVMLSKVRHASSARTWSADIPG